MHTLHTTLLDLASLVVNGDPGGRTRGIIEEIKTLQRVLNVKFRPALAAAVALKEEEKQQLEQHLVAKWGEQLEQQRELHRDLLEQHEGLDVRIQNLDKREKRERMEPEKKLRAERAAVDQWHQQLVGFAHQLSQREKLLQQQQSLLQARQSVLQEQQKDLRARELKLQQQQMDLRAQESKLSGLGGGGMAGGGMGGKSQRMTSEQMKVLLDSLHKNVATCPRKYAQLVIKEMKERYPELELNTERVGWGRRMELSVWVGAGVKDLL